MTRKDRLFAKPNRNPIYISKDYDFIIPAFLKNKRASDVENNPRLCFVLILNEIKGSIRPGRTKWSRTRWSKIKLPGDDDAEDAIGVRGSIVVDIEPARVEVADRNTVTVRIEFLSPMIPVFKQSLAIVDAVV